MKYTVRKSVIRVLGVIWMPSAEGAAEYTLSACDTDNARDDDGNITRDSVSRWLDSRSGDFAEVTDFSASIEDGDETVDIPWDSEDNEMAWGSLMYPEEEEW
jgi:hypothetical protein